MNSRAPGRPQAGVLLGIQNQSQINDFRVTPSPGWRLRRRIPGWKLAARVEFPGPGQRIPAPQDAPQAGEENLYTQTPDQPPQRPHISISIDINITIDGDDKTNYALQT